jgi:hypothetical protein
VKEFASLGMVVVAALLFLAFLTTIRPSAIVAVQGDSRANEAQIGGLERLLTSRDPARNARTDWAAKISTH